MKKQVVVLLALVVLISLFAFTAKHSFLYPTHFPKPIYPFSNDTLSKAKIELGRVLFYDPILSKDGSISCASCHSSYNAFAHTDHDLSHGINDQIGFRNAPALFNLAWQQQFMWDGAINHLDMQALAPITHPKEMGENLTDVVTKLQSSTLYKTLFKNAYDDTLVTGERLLKVMSQFQLTLVSSESKYDKVIKKQTSFTEQEQRGYTLFKQHCNSCHTEPLFSNYRFANNGLPIDSTLNDFGKMNITKKKEDSLLFKIPTLRNLSYTFPYMHDGRFKKLNEVLHHYSQGIKPSATLSVQLKNNINLSPYQKTDLMAFILTLNDSAFVFNPNHKYPHQIFGANPHEIPTNK
ncbi:MAG: cytochrome-c peroxidase [Bacteroidia bacterium]